MVNSLPPFWRIGKKSIVDAVLDEARKRGLRAIGIEQNQLMIENCRCQVLPGKLIRGDRKERDSVRLYPPFSWPTDVFIYVVRSQTSANAHTIFVLPAEKRFKGGAWSINSQILQPFEDGWNLLRAPEAFPPMVESTREEDMRVVYFDLETGGLGEGHPDIQIAAVATEAFTEIDAFEAKIQFQEELADQEALKLNSYNPTVWKLEAKPEAAVVGEFSAFLRKHSTVEIISKRTGSAYKIARLAGHNVAQFDAPRLAAMFKRHNQFLPAESYRPLDTLQLALWYSSHLGKDPKSFKLADLCEAFGVSSEGAHDALVDVRMCVKLSRVMLERFSNGAPVHPGART